MRKIRIGNDIRLKLKIKTLQDKEGWENFNWGTIDEFDQTNVKQLRCYLINTSFFDCCGCKDDCKKHQRIGFPDFYHPTHHNINNCGIPCYHMAPANMCNYDKFSPDFHDFHWWPGYRGFGVYPEHFHEYCDHMHWHGPRPSHYYPHCHNHNDPHCCEPFYHGYDHHGIAHCKPEPFDTWFHPEYVPQDVFGKENVVLNHPHPYTPYYLADSQVLNEKNTLTCMFPAVQQKMCGTYKLVVVLTVFEQGWGRHNLHTYTIDKGDVFELVDCGGESGPITLDVDSTGEKEGVVESIFTQYDMYVLPTNKTMKIGELDSRGKEYNIYTMLKDGTKILYNPLEWRYDQLLFESHDPDKLTIDADGTIHTHNINDVEETVQVTVKSAVPYQDNPERYAQYTFDVVIQKLNIMKMGFSNLDAKEYFSSDTEWLKKYDADAPVFVVRNYNNGDYLWILSQRKIAYIKSVEDEKIADLSSGFRVPTTDFGKKEGYFCYRSTAQILDGNMRIKIFYA